MTVKIRVANPEDVASITHFQICMADETEEKQLDATTVKAGVEQVFENSNSGFYLVATTDDGTVVGSLLITFEWSDWRNSNMWYIQSVYLLPEYRGQKIFSAMFAEVKRLANEQQVLFVRLYVETDNTHAQSVYEALGMKRLPYYMYDIDLKKA